MIRLASPLVMTAFVVVALPAGLHAQDPHMERARRVLSSVPLIDGHNDLPWAIRNFAEAPFDVRAYDVTRRTRGHTDVERLTEGMVGAQFWSVYIPYASVDSGPARMQLEQIDIAKRLFALYPQHFAEARDASDIERIFGSGRIASMLGVEGGHAIENSLGTLRAYYELGVRYMTLTHSRNIDWADSATDLPRHGGLTEFGREVVREMNRLGMLVDLSHTHANTMHHALDVTEAPVIFSHSSARALTRHPRNVPDEVLRRLPENGGVVMVTFVPSFVSEQLRRWSEQEEAYETELRGRLDDEAAIEREVEAWRAQNPPPRATLAEVADHIEYVRDVAGIEHVGIGGDYDGITSVPVGLEDVSRYPALFAELSRRGWSEGDLEKLAGLNVLRVMRQAEAVARRLQRERGPSTATIEELDGAGGNGG